MPFPPQKPLVFNRATIEGISPTRVGCYGLLNSDGWIYVGKGHLRDRLLAHLDGDNPRITRCAPTHFVADLSPNVHVREKELIVELNPPCNQKVG